MNSAKGRTENDRRFRKTSFAVCAMLLGLSPLLVSEVVLRLCDAGRVSDATDPYVGFLGTQRLFERNTETGRYEVAPARQTYFRPESFALEKGVNEFRIFCLGGSTVQGRPYAIETSFTSWLELALQASDTSRNWEVVNCGGVSYASYRLAPILRELLTYQPDLIVIYTGHNEFLEDRTYAQAKQTSRWITLPHTWLTRLRTYNSLRSAWIRWRPSAPPPRSPRSLLATEVDAKLDYRGGLDDYRRDDPWRNAIIRHFEFNLRRMVVMARHAGVPVILANPVSNLKDTPPFKFLNRDDITPAEQRTFQELWDAASQAESPLDERIALLQRAIAIDPRHAGVRFHLGKCYQDQQLIEEAAEEYVRAKDEDVCPLRILSSMSEIIRQVASDASVPLIDIQRMFAQLTPDGITGSEWLVDHVHPSIQGHQRIAAALLQEMARQGIVSLQPGWQARRDALYHERFESLDALYYIRANQRLEGLRTWSQGGAKRTRPSADPAASESEASR